MIAPIQYGQPMPDPDFESVDPEALGLVRDWLDSDWTVNVLQLMNGTVGDIPKETFLVASAILLANADEGQRARFLETLTRAKLLQDEIWALAEAEPDLIRKYDGDVDLVALGLSTMLAHLALQLAGSFARFGRDNDAAWVRINDLLDKLEHVTDKERALIQPCAAYIRQMGAFPTTGAQQLYSLP